MSSRAKEVDIFKKLLNEVNPISFMPNVISFENQFRILTILDDEYRIKPGQQIFIIGTGKASSSMAVAMEEILGEQLSGGCIISSPDPLHRPKKIILKVGSHPYPDARSEHASQNLLKFIESIPEGSLVINLISGGTSSLFCQPKTGISIDELSRAHRVLVTSGASIDEINTVRKSLSQVKGGKLLKKLKHVDLIDLIISDVPDDNPADIGSGPTTKQDVSVTDAVNILGKYNLWEEMPSSIKRALQSADNEAIKNAGIETPGFHQTHILTSAKIVAKRAAEMFEQNGCSVTIDEVAWSGPIDNFVQHICSQLNNQKPSFVHIFYGECTISISGDGKGGRNQELALRMAKEISEEKREVVFLSAGTDGIDGPTEAAGAVVDQSTWRNAEKSGIDPNHYLANNDSYHFFDKAGGHIITGPTGNNVMDIQFLIID